MKPASSTCIHSAASESGGLTRVPSPMRAGHAGAQPEQLLPVYTGRLQHLLQGAGNPEHAGAPQIGTRHLAGAADQIQQRALAGTGDLPVAAVAAMRTNGRLGEEGGCVVQKKSGFCHTSLN